MAGDQGPGTDPLIFRSRTPRYLTALPITLPHLSSFALKRARVTEMRRLGDFGI
jgi:hypothetical protein